MLATQEGMERGALVLWNAAKSAQSPSVDIVVIVSPPPLYKEGSLEELSLCSSGVWCDSDSWLYAGSSFKLFLLKGEMEN